MPVRVMADRRLPTRGRACSLVHTAKALNVYGRRDHRFPPTVMALPPGHELGEHHSPGETTLQVQRGVRLARSEHSCTCRGLPSHGSARQTWPFGRHAMTPGLVEQFEGAAKLDCKTSEPGPAQATDRFKHAPADLAVPQCPTSAPLLVISSDDFDGLRFRTAGASRLWFRSLHWRNQAREFPMQEFISSSKQTNGNSGPVLHRPRSTRYGRHSGTT